MIELKEFKGKERGARIYRVEFNENSWEWEGNIYKLGGYSDDRVYFINYSGSIFGGEFSPLEGDIFFKFEDAVKCISDKINTEIKQKKTRISFWKNKSSWLEAKDK